VVVVLIDDLGYGDVGAFGAPHMPTPHIDSLARDGVRFTQGYATASVCSPSRTSLMLGIYAQRTGKYTNDQVGVPIPDGHPTFAQFMRDAGYVTGMVGRWHIGSSGQGPLESGFMYLAERPPGVGPQGPNLGPSYIADDGSYWTDLHGAELAEFVARHRAEPFFLYFAPLAVHSPVQEAPAKYLQRVPPEITGKRRYLAATLIAVDDALGTLLAELRKHRLDEHTIIFFAGDNGGAAKSEARNAPYRGGKGSKWDGGVHEPYIIRWTGRLPAGATFDGLSSTMDFYATAAALTNNESPANLDGTNLIPYLTGAKEGEPHRDLYFHGHARAVRSGKWRMTVDGGLFDIHVDPAETTDLSNEHPDVVARLTERFTAWEATLKKPKAAQ
jgi:arylsulfatase A-like enzyme